MPTIKYPTPLQPQKYALLVGASRGIGAALARKLAREGYTLALLSRDSENLNLLCEEINAEYGELRALAYKHDVTEYQSAKPLFKKIIAEMGGLDLFIYNAGIMAPVALDEYSFEKDHAILQTNLLGAIAWLNLAAEMFHGLGKGHIVGIGSVAGDRGRVGAPAYNTSKAGLHTFLEALRNRLGRRGVRVLTVKPGFVDTDLLKNSSSKRAFLVSSPEAVADGIWRAISKGRQVVYLSKPWGLIMHIIKHIPSFIFRRMSF